jgi:hypothetical protein
MDPNACLAEIRRLYAAINEADEHDSDTLADAARLAELVEALDAWITKGGFLPRAWSR